MRGSRSLWLGAAAVSATLVTAAVLVPSGSAASVVRSSPGRLIVKASTTFQFDAFNAGKKITTVSINFGAPDGSAITTSDPTSEDVLPGESMSVLFSCAAGILCTAVPIMSAGSKSIVPDIYFQGSSTESHVFAAGDWKTVK